MPITVRDLLEQRQFRLELLVDGDLSRPISWVHSIEMPDPAPYLTGAEVVLSAGIWYLGGASPSTFANGLARTGAAAVGFGTTHLISEVPSELIRACRRNQLPLFRVPDDVPFIAVTHLFVDSYLADHERSLLASNRRASELADGARRGTGMRSVLHALRDEPFDQALVFDRQHGLLAHTGRRPKRATIEALAANHAFTQAIDRGGFAVFPVPVPGAQTALAVDRRLQDIPIDSRAAIDQALAFVAIELQRRRAVREAERRYAAEVFDLIAAGDAQAPAVAARLRTLDIDPTRPLLTICCETDDPGSALHAAETALDAHGLRGVIAVKAAELLGLVQTTEADRVTQILSTAIGRTAAVGAASLQPNADGLRTALIEARHACRFIRRTGGGYATHDQIGSHTLLLALQDEDVLAAFRSKLLSPLIEHDAIRGTQLIDTLDRFLNSAGQYQATADALHIHVNTLRLRLERIEALTGRRIASMEDRVDLFIALRTRHTDGDDRR